jgi:hypothetical protein
MRSPWWSSPLFFMVGWCIPTLCGVSQFNPTQMLVGVAIACAWAGYRWGRHHA